MKRKKDEKPELTIKQKKFINEYIKTGKKKQAAINAGYAPKYADRQANQTLKLDYVQDYLNKQLNRLSIKGIASGYDVLKVFSDIVWGKRMETLIAPNSEKVTVPPSNSEVIAAGKEILKRWPDELMKAHIEKTKAETRLAKAKADALTTQDANVDDAVSDLLNKVRAKESDDK